MRCEHSAGHIDQLLRQTRAHHVQLSTMADMKANMLLTVSGVIMTLSVPHLFEENTRLPTAILMFFCLMTILLACYAVMPKLRLRKRAVPDMKSPFINPLFFGDFIHLDYDEYLDTFEKIIKDPASTYEVQVREIYTIGKFLAKQKYRYLQLSYLSFLTGLIVSGATLGYVVLFG